MKVTIDDAGIFVDGPYRTRFLIPWTEVHEIAVEPNPDIDAEETTYVTRLVKKGRGSSLPISKPAESYLGVETTANESVTLAVAGMSADQLRAALAPWVEWPDNLPASSAS